MFPAWRNLPGESSDPYYDMFKNWDLIVSNFLSQCGLRIRTRDFETVSWGRFKALIAGLSPETASGRVVAIRSEKDRGIVRHFTVDQRRIYDDWRNRDAKEMDEKTFDKEMEDLEKMFAAIYSQGGNRDWEDKETGTMSMLRVPDANVL